MKPAQSITERSLIFSGDPLGHIPMLSGNFRKVEREMLQLFSKKDYQQIKTILKNTPDEVKETFFEDFGYSILHYAVTRSSDMKALNLITDNIPVTVIQDLLRNNDFEILKDLIGIQYSIENYTISGQTEEEEVRESMLVSQKLAFLSQIDSELLGAFLEKYEKEKYMSESVTQMLRAAIPVETQRPSSSPL